jgi:lysozyme
VADDLSKKQKAGAAIAAACLICAPLTASFEGLRTKPYKDPVGIPTVCYGETNVQMRAYSKDECGQLLRDHLSKKYAPKIAACLPQLLAPERKHEFAALLDAAYNAGPAAVCKSRMARAIVAGNWRAACDGFQGWYVTAHGVKLKGLVVRRQEERRVCLTPEA